MDIQFSITCGLILLLITLILFHFYVHSSRTGKLIDNIPGAKWFPIIGNIPDLLVEPEALWHFLRRAGRDFYPVHKFWLLSQPVVNLRHPDDVEILLCSNKHIEKSLFYDYLHPWLNTGLLTSTGEKWRSRRKMLTPAFHLNSLQEYCEGVVDRANNVVASLKQEAKSGDVDKELLRWTSRNSLYTICEMAMGKILDDGDPEQDTYRHSVYDMGAFLYYRSVRPWFKNNWIFAMTAKGREHAKALNILHNFSNKIIKERQQYHQETGGKFLDDFLMSSPKNLGIQSNEKPKRKRLAFLDLLIATSKQGSGLSNLDIREEVDTFVFEGHDTTAMGIMFTILLLAQHKEIQARARAEVDAILKESNGKMTMNEIQRFTYLECCIKESQRLYPSVPLISRKISEEVQLKHCLIPEGTIVNIHIMDVHRDPNFWPRPTIYNPDRFLPEQIENRHPFSYIPFSGGPRNCIGQKFAMLVLKSYIAKLLHNFYFEPLETVADIPILPDLILRPAKPTYVKFVPIIK